MTRLLFMCVANSARSQMAEAIARNAAPEGVQVFSAGSRPSRVNPYAVEALKEIGLDPSDQYSKGVDDIPIDKIDMTITLCAEEVCPVFPRPVKLAAWPLPDPAGKGGTDDILNGFRAVRDEIQKRIQALFAEWPPKEDGSAE